MATYQRIALLAIFDAIERDLTHAMRTHLGARTRNILTSEEIGRARDRLSRRSRETRYNLDDHFDLAYGLDIGEKYNVLLRWKELLPADLCVYLSSMKKHFDKAVPIRNDTMQAAL